MQYGSEETSPLSSKYSIVVNMVEDVGQKRLSVFRLVLHERNFRPSLLTECLDQDFLSVSSSTSPAAASHDMEKKIFKFPPD